MDNYSIYEPRDIEIPDIGEIGIDDTVFDTYQQLPELPQFPIETPSEQTPTEIPSEDTRSLYQLIQDENLPMKITSGYRKNSITKSGHKSNHSKLNDLGFPMAYDVQPTFGKSDEDFARLKEILYQNPAFMKWITDQKMGILSEVSPSARKRFGATGKNLHIGQDPGALRQMQQDLVQYAAKGTKFKELYKSYLFNWDTPDFQVPELELPEQQYLSDILDMYNPNESDDNMQNDIDHIFGQTSNKFEEFAGVMIPIFEKALKDNNIETTKDNLYNLVRQAALESNYGLSPRGKNKFNLSGIKWFKGCPYDKTKWEDGEDYVDFPNLEAYADYKVKLLNDKYQAFGASSTTDFVNRLHGQNPSKANYSASKQNYLTSLNNMKSLNKYLS